MTQATVTTDLSQAPDAMVVLGRPDGDRGSYKQWKEDNIPPQVVFEIISPSNSATEISQKQAFYDRYGVLEMVFYDPDNLEFWGLTRQAPDERLVLHRVDSSQDLLCSNGCPPRYC